MNPLPCITTFHALINAGVLAIGDGYRAKNSELGGTGPIFLRAGHVSDAQIDLVGADRFNEVIGLHQFVGKTSRAYDVLVTTKGNSTGRVAFVALGFPEVVYSPHLSFWRSLDARVLDPGFLRYWARASEFREQLVGLMASTDMAPYLSLVDQRRLRISLPLLPTQRAIARILGALDDKIELNRRMNETLEGMARAIFHSWFVDFDPVRAKREGRRPDGMDDSTASLFSDTFDNSELGPIPRGWRHGTVRDVSEGIYDGPHATPPEAESGPIFLGIKNFTPTMLDLAEVRHISDSDWPNWTKRVVPTFGDIVFTYEATLGFFALIPQGLRCCLGRRTALVRPKKDDGNAHFLFHWFVAPPFQQFLKAHRQLGSTVDRIWLKDFPGYPVLLPPHDLVRRFDQSSAALWAQIHSLQAQTTTLTCLRDTLLPKLLSGELSVPEAETAVDKAL